MNAHKILSTLSLIAGMAAFAPAGAEILLLEDGAVSMDAGSAYVHPTLRSVVFISPEARQMAILPPSPIFVQPPPLLMRAPSPFPVYPPAGAVTGVNSSARPSNRDVTTYHLQRAHSFGQGLYNRDTYLSLGFGTLNNGIQLGTTPFAYWGGTVMPAYPPPAPGSTRPSNRDNTTYNLERAHRFSMDAYKKP